MLLSLSVPALASETSSDRAELIELACDVFPEYEDKIRNQDISLPFSRSSQKREIVATTARAVSENETLIYTEYSDGVILLTDSYCEPNKPTITTNDSLVTPTYSHVDINIKATCTNVTGYFYLEDVQYTLYYSDYDCITNTGTASVPGKCYISDVYTPVLNETSTKNAQISYRLGFQFGSGGYIMKKLRSLICCLMIVILFASVNTIPVHAVEIDNIACDQNTVVLEKLQIWDSGYLCITTEHEDLETVTPFGYTEKTKTFDHSINDRDGDYAVTFSSTVTGVYSDADNYATINSVTGTFSNSQVSSPWSYSVSYNGSSATVNIKLSRVTIGTITYTLHTNGSLTWS